MLRTSWPWRCVGAMVLLTACGGEPFVVGDASAQDAATADVDHVVTDGAVTSFGVRCPNNSPCSRSDAPPKFCCTIVSSPTSSNCTAGSCGCYSELECAVEANCPGTACCISSQLDTNCATGHPVAQCARTSVCPVGSARLCDPNGPPCPAGRGCSQNSSDLSAVGLPAGQGYGVCK